ncbi:MAG: transposase [Roseburia sp.]|nr:transposase [Anaeroplasma bactoclasticum]MCM1196839.1 transposase [Roseburia sp.]
MVGKRYSSQYKIAMVEEYLKLVEKDPKLPMAEFARRNELSDSTFNDWVIKYKRQGQGFCNITNEIKKLGSIIDSTPVIIPMVNNIEDERALMSVNKIRMKYNGAIIEFDESLLERALKILKTW